MARLVVVEDETQVLMLAESVLRQVGHETMDARTVAEAQAIINSKDEKFDLLFTDIHLGNHPEGGLTLGKLIEATRRERRSCTQVPIPPLMECNRYLCSRAAFLAKPYTAQELIDAVAALVQKRFMR